MSLQHSISPFPQNATGKGALPAETDRLKWAGAARVADRSSVPGVNTQRDYRRALGQFATGITIVTAASIDGPSGFTANSFSSVSLDPPLVLWSIARSSHRYELFAHAKHLAIHVLSASQKALSQRFSLKESDFQGLDWYTSEQGVPLLAQCLARFECTQYAVHAGGDHSIIVCRVERVAMSEGDPLLYAGGQYAHLLHAIDNSRGARQCAHESGR